MSWFLDYIIRAKNEAKPVVQGAAKDIEQLEKKTEETAVATQKWTAAQQRAAMAMSGLHEQALKMNAGMDKHTSLVDDIKANWAAWAAVGATVGIAVKMLTSELVDAAGWAENLGKAVRVTGLSAESFQKLTTSAEELGFTAEDIVTAMKKVNNAVVDGAPAVQALGLSLEKLRDMSPEERLQAVAQALTNVSDDAERSKLAMDIWGRSGAEMVPLLDEIASGAYKLNTAVGEEQVAALGKADAALDKLGSAWKVFKRVSIGSIVEIADKWNTFSLGLMGINPNAPAALAPLPKDSSAYLDTSELSLGPETAAQKAAVQAYREELKKAEEHAKKFKEEQKRAATETAKLGFVLLGLDNNLRAAQASFDAWDRTVVETTADLKLTKDDFEDFSKALGQGPEMDLGVIDSQVKAAANAAKKAWSDASVGGHLKNSMRDALKDLPNVILGAIQGGGDVGKAIGAHLGGTIGTSLSESLGPMLTKSLGKTLGGALGSLLPGLGSLLGNALGGLADKAFGKLFKTEQKHVNDLRDSFIEAHGGWQKLQGEIAKATNKDLLKKLFDAKNVKDYNAAIEEIQRTLGLLDTAQQDVNDAIQKYGFTVDELGPKWAQQELDKQAASLLKEYELLHAAGVDHNAIIARMGPELSKYVEEAAKAGAEIPSSMKPAIDAMYEQGKLVHENGEAYTEAEYKALKYGTTMTEAMISAVDAIRDLVAALTGIPRNVDTNVNVNRRERTFREGETPPGETPQGMERGGVVLPFMPRAANGIVAPRPGGTPVIVGEGGDTELVAPVKALAREIGAGLAAIVAGGGPQIVNVYIGSEKLDTFVLNRTRTGHMRVDAAGVRARG